MESHDGAIVEKVVRRSGLSITELARRCNVNRRSVYNWFNQKTLKLDVIIKIGGVLEHDFSQEFPESFDKKEFAGIKHISDPDEQEEEQPDQNNIHYWMSKYIVLLEKYNELLQNQNPKDSFFNPIKRY